MLDVNLVAMKAYSHFQHLKIPKNCMHRKLQLKFYVTLFRKLHFYIDVLYFFIILIKQLRYFQSGQYSGVPLVAGLPLIESYQPSPHRKTICMLHFRAMIDILLNPTNRMIAQVLHIGLCLQYLSEN